MTGKQQPYYYQLIEKSSRYGIPLSVLVELTNRCNLKCSHCYVVKDKGSDELTTVEVYRLFDRLADEGCLFLTLSGGEMFLREDILDIAAYARTNGFVLTLFTNGTLINEYIATRLANLYLEAVELSLYSLDSDLHDTITGVKGSHEATLRAIHILRNKGVPVTVKSALMKENIKDYQDIIRFAKGLDIKYIFDPFITPRADGDIMPISMRLNPDEAACFLKEMDNRGGEYELADSHELPALKEEICAMGKRTCVISPRGDLFPCLLFPESAGNVREKNFRKIWRESPLLNYLRGLTLADLKDACSTCKKLDYCQRCSPVALMEDGDLLGPSSWSCNLSEVL
ncbi:MAG: radical SAM/SPASM domain-containing protein [Thermodesulfobacteriota bacterium]